MKLTELMNARDYLATQREAMRLLSRVIERMDIRVMPDGTVKFSFDADVELVDRLAMWGSAVQDLEGEGSEDEDGGDHEPEDGREFPKLRQSAEELAHLTDVSEDENPALMAIVGRMAA